MYNFPVEFSNNALIIMILVGLWTIPWKGVALWRAAKRGERNWFIAILILNTFAILEIFYIFAITRKPPKNSAVPETKKDPLI